MTRDQDQLIKTLRKSIEAIEKRERPGDNVRNLQNGLFLDIESGAKFPGQRPFSFIMLIEAMRIGNVSHNDFKTRHIDLLPYCRTIWKSMLEDCSRGENFDVFPVIELAKHLEHRQNSYTQAETLIQTAVEKCPKNDKILQKSLFHRLKRLQTKKNKKNLEY